MRALALAILLAGCHDLPDLGSCGNGIIEAELGEACDGDESGADTCSDTCQLICQTSAVDERYVAVSPPGAPEQVFCPDSRMACGIDNVCRASSGQFLAVGGQQPFDVKFAVTGDFDGDRITDLVGTSATQVVVRLGSTSTPLADGFAQAAPSSDSPIAIFDRDPDSIPMTGSDMAIGVPTDGLSILSSDTLTFGPDLDLTFAADADGQVQVVVRDPDPGIGGSDIVVSIQRMGVIAVKRIAISDVHTENELAQCGGPNSQVVAVAVSRDQTSFVVIGRPIANPNAFFVCNYVPIAGALTMAQTNFAGAAPNSAVLAQLDDDACLDLAVLRDVGNGPPALALLPSSGAPCGFFTGAIVPIAVGPPNTLIPDDVLLASGSIVPRAAGPERDELVLASGVYQLEGSLSRVIAPTSEINPWTAAAVVDLSGDGRLDVVAGRRNQDDVDVVRGGAVPNVYRADTDSNVIATTAGDFDGDGLGDVALIEQGVVGERVSILYGVRDGTVGEPVANSRFGGSLRVARARRITWLDTTRGVDGVDDLIVVQTLGLGPAATTRGGVMVGDAARLMTVPRLPPFANLAAPQSIGVVGVAKFDGNNVVALAVRPDHPLNPTGSRLAINSIDPMNATMWADGMPVNGFVVDTLRPPAVIRTAGLPRLAAFGRGAMGGDAAPFGVIDLAGNTCTGTIAGNGTSIRGVDLDGDGVDELVVISNSNGGRFLQVVPVTTAGPSCTIGSPLFESLLGCADITRVGDHVVALCPVGEVSVGGIDMTLPRFGIFRVGADGTRERNPAVTLDGVGLELVVGDYDGDGVPDLAVGIGRAAEVSVQFIKQCPAHDVRGCN